MDQRIEALLQEARYKNAFPPPERVSDIKSSMSLSGNLNSGACMTEIAEAYYECTEAVLEQFAKNLLSNCGELNIKSDSEIHAAVQEAIGKIFPEASGSLAQDVRAFKVDLKNLAMRTFEERLPRLRDHINRMVTLRGLNTEHASTAIQISGGQIGNLVVGSVNQSQLNAAVHQIVNQGGPEADAARLVQGLIDAIGRMDEAQKSQQAELYDLVKGLLHQIRLPKEERSPSTIKVIYEHLIKVANVSSEVTQLIQQNLPQVLAALGLG